MTKKSKITIMATFLIGLLFIIFSKSAKADDEETMNTCQKVANFYFVEATSNSANSSSEYDTTFQAPDGWEIENINSIVINPVSSSEMNEYLSVQQQSNFATSYGTSWCDEDYTNCVNSGLKTGEGEGYIIQQSDVENGMDFSNYIIEYNNASVDLDEDSFTSGGNTIPVNIKRTWTPRDTSDGYNGEYLFIPAVVTVDFTYKTTDECDGTIPETPVCETNSNAPNISLNCNGGGEYQQVKNETLTAQHQVEVTDTTRHVCNQEVTEYVSAETNFYQTGKINFRQETSKFAGGGFYFFYSYTNLAWWNYCDGQNEASCSRNEQYPSCTQGGQVASDNASNYENLTCNNTGTYNSSQQNCSYNCTETYTTTIIRSTNTDTSYECRSYSDTGYYDWDSETGYCRYEQEVERTRSLTLTGDYDCATETINTCVDQEDANQLIYEAAAGFYEGLTDNVKVTSQDSNNETDTNVNKTVKGNTSINGSSELSSWEPGDKKNTSMTFSLANAYIERHTAEVTYETPSSIENYVDGDTLYYIPLKYRDGSNFKIKAESDNISSLSNMTWKLNYNCDVDCYQKIYNNGTGRIGGFKFIYRPINLSNPFPNRSPGSNWTQFMRDSTALNKLTRDDPEYQIILGPTAITSLKGSASSYFDLTTISNEGYSNVSYVNSSRQSNTTINKLGECTNECW